MKKAKELAQPFLEVGTEGKGLLEKWAKTTAGFYDELVKEMGELIFIRNPQTNSAGYAIYKEIKQKHQAVARILEKHYGQPVLKEDGLERVLENFHPELWETIQKMEKKYR